MWQGGNDYLRHSFVGDSNLNLADPNPPTGTLVPYSGTANTLSAKVELGVAQHDFDAIRLHFIPATSSGAVAARWLVSVFIGPSGSEKVIIPNVSVQQVSLVGMTGLECSQWPAQGKAGDRLSIAAQSTGNIQGYFYVELMQGGSLVGRRTVAAVNTALSTGVAIPTAAANVWTAWQQMTADLEIDCVGYRLMFSEASSQSIFNNLLQVGVRNQADTDYVPVDTFGFQMNSRVAPIIDRLGKHLPAGRKIAIRSKSSLGAGSNGAFNVAMYGFSV